MNLIRRLDQAARERAGANDQVEAAIANFELAARMQTAVPELMDLSGESRATRQLYGLDDSVTAIYAQRHLVQRGGWSSAACASSKYSAHRPAAIAGISIRIFTEASLNNALHNTDKPVAGLLRDLKARGLLESTLVVWGGEFGRTPMAQGTDGRDHNPFRLPRMWLAGVAIKGVATIYGAPMTTAITSSRTSVWKSTDLHALPFPASLGHGTHLSLTLPVLGGRDMR